MNRMRSIRLINVFDILLILILLAILVVPHSQNVHALDKGIQDVLIEKRLIEENSAFQSSPAVGTPYLVKDIKFTGDSNPEQLTDVEGTLFFSADDGIHGYELWKSDGDETSTVMVKDINSAGNSLPTNLTNVGRILFFNASDGENGDELWRSDGTEEGTWLVKDINPLGSSNPSGLIRAGDLLFFAADDGTHGMEIWRSDGTVAGTEMVKDIYPSGSSSQFHWYHTEMNGTLYFLAYDDIHGRELWKSDGTSGGTVLVKDIYPGPDSSMDLYRFIEAVGDTLYLFADDGSHGYALWKSDGTKNGTVLVKEGIAADCFYGCFTSSIGSKLYFNLGHPPGDYSWDLWESDGTATGTKLVKDFPLVSSLNQSQVSKENDKFFFSVDDGIHGIELWVSDGTSEGTVLVKDINPEESSWPRYFATTSELLFFGADDGTHGNELWMSDGTELGTQMVMDILICDMCLGSGPQFLTISGSKLYFKADGGKEIGFELWALELGLIKDLTLIGANAGRSGDEYIFTAEVGPIDAVTPIKYEWRATEQVDVTNNGGLTDSVQLTWNTPGIKKVSVTANNGVNELYQELEIVIDNIDSIIFIPFVFRK